MFTHSGMGGMELVACYLKSQGALLSRTLSYEGARFELVEAELGNDHVESYNQSAVLWQVGSSLAVHVGSPSRYFILLDVLASPVLISTST